MPALTTHGKYSIKMGAEMGNWKHCLSTCRCTVFASVAAYLIYIRFLAEGISPGLQGSLLLLHAHSSGAGGSPSAAHWLLPKSRDAHTKQHCASSHFTFQRRICVCRSREIYHRGRDPGDSFQEIILKSTKLFSWTWNRIQIKEG